MLFFVIKKKETDREKCTCVYEEIGKIRNAMERKNHHEKKQILRKSESSSN